MINYEKLRNLLGDDEFVKKYLALVRIEVPNELKELNALIKVKDYKQASVIAHSIKGQCNYMGLEECAELALEIEQATESNEQEINIISRYEKLQHLLVQKLNI